MHICQVEKAGISIATADSAYVYLCVDNEFWPGFVPANPKLFGLNYYREKTLKAF